MGRGSKASPVRQTSLNIQSLCPRKSSQGGTGAWKEKLFSQNAAIWNVKWPEGAIPLVSRGPSALPRIREGLHTGASEASEVGEGLPWEGWILEL